MANIIINQMFVCYDPMLLSNNAEPSFSFMRLDVYDHPQIGCAFGYAVGDDHSPYLCDWRWLDKVLAGLDWLEKQTGTT